MKNKFIDSNKMVTAYENETVCENAILFTAYYLYLNTIMKNKDDNYMDVINAMPENLNDMEFREGYFVPMINEDGLPYIIPEENISHDNLTGIIALLAFYDMTRQINSIWEVIADNFGKYDMVNTHDMSITKILHPRDYIFYGIVNNKLIGWILLPVLFIIMLISCLQKYESNGTTIRTTGKLLTWLRCQVMIINRNSLIFKLMFKLYSFIVKSGPLKTWEENFVYYFNNQVGHPIVNTININKLA